MGTIKYGRNFVNVNIPKDTLISEIYIVVNVIIPDKYICLENLPSMLVLIQLIIVR